MSDEPKDEPAAMVYGFTPRPANKPEPDRSRRYVLPFEGGDAFVLLPARLHRVDVVDLRNWFDIILRSAERTAMPDKEADE